MNARLWWPSVAAALNGSRSIPARRGSVHERPRAAGQPAHTPASPSAGIQPKGAKATELWSSVVTRAIHHVEELTMLLIMAHFALGILAFLFGG
jgi:hypothetical protein